MIRNGKIGRRCLTVLCGWALSVGSWDRAEAGGYFRRRGPAPPAAIYAPAPAVLNPTAFAPTSPPPSLGTFYETPYLTVRGNGPIGGGYSPLDQFGDTTMVLNGPLSAFRSTAAPVRAYSSGYDGRPVVVEGTSFSNPLQPALSPVIYPTQATPYYGPRRSTTPPWWNNANTWIDQN